ncbi:hypothetical protein DHEL01_v207093 [Diaporthe helianthi]|uniref:Uncharacterized protein n=1 Tax=Diaporthe helianthi TaxID=158607 RepID=A0A2P5HWA3_DIAHE|nr:hypothetical protein DHEL01_v207093 [Diaporthe helianthi]
MVADGCLETLKVASSLAEKNIPSTRRRGQRHPAPPLTRHSDECDIPVAWQCTGRACIFAAENATFLETSLNRSHDSFVPSSRPPSFATRQPSPERGECGATTASGAAAEEDPAAASARQSFQTKMGQLPSLDCEV